MQAVLDDQMIVTVEIEQQPQTGQLDFGGWTMALRVAAMFVILGAGLLGALPPVLSSWVSKTPQSAPARLIKAYAGGIILALSLVHIIPEAYEQLAGGPLPLGGITVVAGLLFMVVLEYGASFLSKRVRERSGLQEPLLPTAQHIADCSEPEHAHEPCEPCNKLCKVPISTTAAASAQEAHAAAPVKQQVGCVALELGCLFHSLVLGLALGVVGDSTRAIVTLTAVLTVHQAIEGVALGSVLAATQRMARSNKLLLAVLYAFSLPVGIAAGLALAGIYDPASPKAQLVQGIANGISGGMLLYMSLLNLLVPELTQLDVLHRPLVGAALLLGIIFGAAAMCLLGFWGV